MNEHLLEGDRLALSARDAAAALGISERLLWSLSVSGQIPSFRIGRRRLYRRDSLESWLQEQEAKEQRAPGRARSMARPATANASGDTP